MILAIKPWVNRQTAAGFHRLGFSRPPLRDHPVFSAAADWLVGANRLLRAWSDLIHQSEGDQEWVHEHLIRVLVRLKNIDFPFGNCGPE